MKSFIPIAALVAVSAAHVSHPDRRDRCKNDACQQGVNLPLCSAFQTRTVYQTTSTVYVSRSAATPSASTRSSDDNPHGRPSVTRSSDDSSVSLVPRKDGKGKDDDKTRHGGNDDSPSSSDDNPHASPTPTPPTVSASKTDDRFDDGSSATPEVPSEVAAICKGKSDVRKACECIGVPTGTLTLSGTAVVTRTKSEDRPSASASSSKVEDRPHASSSSAAP